MPLETLPGLTGQPAPNVVLVTGSGIDDTQLSAVVSKVIPGGLITFRSAVLASLASSPLQHGAALIVVLTIATAGAFGLFIVILGLALGSAEREVTLARLTVMGHERETGLVMAEAMPAVLAAVVAGAACAVLLPRLIGSSIDLSAFTGTATPGPVPAGRARARPARRGRRAARPGGAGGRGQDAAPAGHRRDAPGTLMGRHEVIREGGMSRIPGLSRAVGAAAGSTLALALLVCGCVFAAMAGPALSLHTQSQALHQSLAGLAATTDTVQVTAQWLGLRHRAGTEGRQRPAGHHAERTRPGQPRDRPGLRGGRASARRGRVGWPLQHALTWSQGRGRGR